MAMKRNGATVAVPSGRAEKGKLCMLVEFGVGLMRCWPETPPEGRQIRRYRCLEPAVAANVGYCDEWCWQVPANQLIKGSLRTWRLWGRQGDCRAPAGR